MTTNITEETLKAMIVAKWNNALFEILKYYNIPSDAPEYTTIVKIVAEGADREFENSLKTMNDVNAIIAGMLTVERTI